MKIRGQLPPSVKALISVMLGLHLKAAFEGIDLPENGPLIIRPQLAHKPLENMNSLEDGWPELEALLEEAKAAEVGLVPLALPSEEIELPKDQSFLEVMIEATATFFDSSEILGLVQAKNLEELESLYPMAYARTSSFMKSLAASLEKNFSFDELTNLFSFDELQDLMDEGSEAIEWGDNGALSEQVENIIIASADLMMETSMRTMKAIKELGQEKSDALAHDLLEISFRTHTNFFVCLEILGGGLPKPEPSVLDELVRQFSFSVRLFRQESKRIIWSQTESGKKRRRQVRNLLDRKRQQQNTSQSQVSSSERKLIEQRNDEIMDELKPFRERANKTIGW